MTARGAASLAAGLALLGTQGAALSLAECTRTTHVSHGGEAFHRDLGEGRVLWLDWWSQEGMAHDLMIVECGTGAALRARSAEENMKPRPPFHRTERALSVIEAQHAGARVFATLPRIAAALDDVAKDIEIGALEDEACACASAYPDLRGDKAPFLLTGNG